MENNTPLEMSGFKVGDVVAIVEDHRGFYEGDFVEVVADDADAKPLVRKGAYEDFTNLYNIRKVKAQKEENADDAV